MCNHDIREDVTNIVDHWSITGPASPWSSDQAGQLLGWVRWVWTPKHGPSTHTHMTTAPGVPVAVESKNKFLHIPFHAAWNLGIYPAYPNTYITFAAACYVFVHYFWICFMLTFFFNHISCPTEKMWNLLHPRTPLRNKYKNGTGLLPVCHAIKGPFQHTAICFQ